MTAVRSSQIRNVASSRLLGNATGSNAAAQELSVSQVRTLLGLGSAAYEPSGSFAPASHGHAQSDITGLVSALAGKSSVGHTHVISDVAFLQSSLDGKAAVSHTHVISDITNLQTSLDGKSNTGHTHSIAEVLGLQTALDGKAASSHVHDWSAITTGKPTTLAGYGITDAQPLDSDLTAIAALTTTAFGRSVLTQADGPAIRTLIGAGTSSFDGAYSSLSGIPSSFTPSAHTHTAANITDFSEAVDDEVATLLTAGSGITLNYNDVANTLTISATGGGSGITSLGGQTGSTQTFQTATTGTDFTISSTGDVHTFAIPDASASARGLVTTGAQTFAGDKTFTGTLIGDANIFSNNTGGTATIGIRNGSGGVNRIQMLYGTGFQMASTYAVTWSPNSTNVNSPDLFLYRDAAGTLAQRNSTNAQTFNIANTWTSSTSFEYGRFQWNTNEFRIGTAVGSAGGTQRNLVLGSWNTAGAWNPTFTMTPSGVVTVNTVGSGAATLTIDNSGVFGNGRVVMGAGGVHGQSITFDPRGTSNWSTVTTNSQGLRLVTGGTFDFSNVVALAPLAATSGSQTGFTFTAPAPTGQTASTEATMVNWNLASTVTFAAGALTTQRAFRIQAPTYAFASASTITTASTLSISGAPAAGTNATITNAYALNVESGISNFNGRIFITDGASSIESNSWAGATLILRNSGAVTVGLGSSGIRMALGYAISFCSDTSINNPDVFLFRDAAGTLAQRNSTNAQTFRVYNTFTSATSNEFINIGWATNVAQIGTVKGSAGGSARDLVLQTDGVTRMTFGAAGTATVNTAFVAGSTALINAGSQAFSSSFHLVSWNNGCIGWASTGTVTAASSLDTALKRVSAGLVEINTGTAGVYGNLVLKDLRMSTPTVPATSSSTGSEGQISWDANYIYVCTATNTWKRAALATW